MSSLRAPWQNGPFKITQTQQHKKHVEHRNARDIQKKVIWVCVLRLSCFSYLSNPTRILCTFEYTAPNIFYQVHVEHTRSYVIHSHCIFLLALGLNCVAFFMTICEQFQKTKISIFPNAVNSYNRTSNLTRIIRKHLKVHLQEVLIGHSYFILMSTH